jgi:hypothetical protein
MQTFLRLPSLAALVAVVLIASGCAAPPQRLSEADRNQARTVRISETVQKAPDVFLLAPSGANIGLMFGAVGGLAASGAIEAPRKPFQEFLLRNSISIEKIVREEIDQVVRQSGKVTIVGPEDTSAPVIQIAVEQYGFGVVHLLSSNVVPVLKIKCEMVDNTGRTLWSAGDWMLSSVFSRMESTSWEELRDNPKRIEQQWREASRLMAKTIAEQL